MLDISCRKEIGGTSKQETFPCPYDLTPSGDMVVGFREGGRERRREGGREKERGMRRGRGRGRERELLT